VRQLAARGFREVTLLGQNVNSFDDAGTNFSNLLVAVATAAPEMRFRFTTSHPEDMSDALIDTLAAHDNLCKYIHLPVQSGSDRILKLMNRTYSAEHYLGRVRRIREAMPHAALSTDVIAGFCTETDDDHRRTLDLLAEVRYDGAFTFKYSPRGGTKAWEFGDDVSEEVKSRRLTEIIDLQRRVSLEINGSHVGKLFPVLIEGPSRKSDTEWCGRTDTNKTVVFPRADARTGEYRLARIERASAATLFGVLA
jgi:tRNA-2-methylthio-N6-dimethylallyladenosine synthase